MQALAALPLFLAQADFPLDIRLMTYSVIAFIVIGVGLASMILFTKDKLVSTEECKIFINDDPEMTKETPGGETLLAALSSNGIPIPSPCGGKATCKQCRVQVTDGASPPLETDKATFTTRELKEGWRLSCQSKVKEDIHVHVDEHALSVTEFDCKVISNENVATFIKELVVEAPEDIPYRSGGYLQFHVPSFKTNTSEWKETMEEMYYPDWERFHMFDRTR